MNRGITVGEAVSYGIKHLMFFVLIYIIGIVMFGFGALLMTEEAPGLGAIVILFGVVIILGGLHGAVYKVAGDAAAKAISKSTVTAEKQSRNTSSVAESNSVQQEQNPGDNADAATVESRLDETGDEILVCSACGKPVEPDTDTCPACKEKLHN